MNPTDGVRSLFDAAAQCLAAASVEEKVALTHEAVVAFGRGELRAEPQAELPAVIAMPGRPATPCLVHPRELRKRGLGSAEGRAAFVHSIAHIELNAIDLAWDAVYRFRDMPGEYYADWVSVADDEARHFEMLRDRLQQLGHDYGVFAAHNGLWEMAQKTAHDGMARMALVPRVLEARGLDVTPSMIARLRGLGDEATAAILDTIPREEIAHVAAGSRWFAWHCARRQLEPVATFKALLMEYCGGLPAGPLNDAARLQAGFAPEELRMLHDHRAPAIAA